MANRPFAQLWPGNEVRGIAGQNRLRCVCLSFELSFFFYFGMSFSRSVVVFIAVPIEAWPVLHSYLLVFNGQVSSGSAFLLAIGQAD